MNFNIENKQPIARGRTAEIYAWREGYVLKLFLPNFFPDEAKHEAARVDAICKAGIQTPSVKEIVTVSGRKGFVMGRVDGKSMLVHLQQDYGRVVDYAQQLAELHAQLHVHQSQELISVYDWLSLRIGWADGISDNVKKKALDQLSTLPAGNAVCHGDFHPDNVLLTLDGPIIIDWCNACHGHPLADVARTSLLLSAGGLPPDLSPEEQAQIEQVRQQFHDAYLMRYFELTSITLDQLSPWYLPVAVARISELESDEQAPILAVISQHLD